MFDLILKKKKDFEKRIVGFGMSETITEDDDSGAETTGWTQGNLQKLLASLKDSTPENEKTQAYTRGLKAVDWDKVAFPPFSAEQCQEKWNSMMVKMRKYRSLPELLDEAEEVLSDPLHYKNIHPDTPKPPVPPKMAYIGQKISIYTKKHPGIPTRELTKMFSEKYDKLPDEEKAKYTKKYKLEFDEYSRRMLNFCRDNNLPLPRKSNSKRSDPDNGGEGCSKDEGLPKKPPFHGRALFLKEHSKMDGSSLGVSFLKIMGQRWRKMSKEEKQEYSTRCEKMKREYGAKLVEYLDRLDENEKQRIIKEKGIKIPKQILDQYVRQPGEPKMPPRSGFIYFYKDNSKNSSESLKLKVRMDLVKKHWHELSAREKKRYAVIIQENMRKYSEDLQKWFQTLTAEEQRNYLKKKPSKLRFLQKSMLVKEAPKPSDSEDEDIVLGSESEGDLVMLEDKESEDEKDGKMFEIYN